MSNNDTELTVGAIDRATDWVKDESVGAVGAKLIMPNGLIQEAGSIVWGDGSVLGYARSERIDAHVANFMREVDCCSGAFMMTRTDLFNSIGGFDMRYKRLRG